MAETMIKCKVGIRLANWNASINDPSGSSTLDNADYLGPIYDEDTSSVYGNLEVLQVSKPTDVTVSDLGPMLETFTTTEDPYEYDIVIRQTGGFTFELYETLDTTNGTAPSGLLWGAVFMPHGCNNTSGNASYDPFADSTPGTAATDLRGYTAMLEWETEGGDFRFIKFANCRLKATPAPSPQKASKIRVEITDARIITIGDAGATQLASS